MLLAQERRPILTKYGTILKRELNSPNCRRISTIPNSTKIKANKLFPHHHHYRHHSSPSFSGLQDKKNTAKAPAQLKALSQASIGFHFERKKQAQ
jgi:hypothetical protein